MTRPQAAVAAHVTPLEAGLALGIVGGIGESIAWALARYGLHHYTHRCAELLWTAPVADALVLGLAGLLVWIAVLLRPSLNWWRPTITFLAFAAAFGNFRFVAALAGWARALLAAGVGYQVGNWATRHRPFAQRACRRALPALAAYVVVMCAGDIGYQRLSERRALAGIAAAPAGAPNVLLLILDTVRASELGMYGYPRPTSPEIDRLATRGVAFNRAVAPAPWTLASHASIFTGHDARDLSADWAVPLDRRYPTLAEALRAHGYRTAGYAANCAYVSEESGLARGFAAFDACPLSVGLVLDGGQLARFLASLGVVRGLLGIHEDDPSRIPAPVIRGEVVSWLAGHGDKPWFMFANFYDVHAPYLPPAPYDTMFGPRVPWGQRNLELDQPANVTPQMAQGERNFYDGALASLDHQVGLLLRQLDSLHALDNTIVILTADHGEEFGEHGFLDHGNSLYFPSLHVPLIVAWPGHVPQGRRVAGTIGLRNLAATILDLAGAPSSLPGRSLRPFWEGDPPMTREPVRTEVRFAPGWPSRIPVSRGDMEGVVTDSLQYIRDGHGAESVFDLSKDPEGGAIVTPDTMTLSALRRMAGPAPKRPAILR